jgi:threonine dehydratase
LRTEIVGVQSTEAPSFALSFAAGTVVRTNSSNTLADGMATRVPDADALAIIRKGASRIVQVTDDEVAAVRGRAEDEIVLAEISEGIFKNVGGDLRHIGAGDF